MGRGSVRAARSNSSGGKFCSNIYLELDQTIIFLAKIYRRSVSAEVNEASRNFSKISIWHFAILVKFLSGSGPSLQAPSSKAWAGGL